MFKIINENFKYSTYFKKIKTYPILILKVMILILIVFYIYNFLDLNTLNLHIKKISYSIFFICISLCLCSFMIQTYRWHRITNNVMPQSILFNFSNYWLASLFNLISPASIGGDIYRLLKFKDIYKSMSNVLIYIIQERMLGLFGICLIYIICFVKQYLSFHETMALPFSYLLIAFFSFFVLIIFLNIHLLAFIGIKKFHFFKNVFCYASKYQFLELIGLTLFSIISWIAVFYVLTKTFLDDPIFLEEMGLIATATELIRWIPITLQGVGIREGFAMYSFNIFYLRPDLGFLVAGLAYIMNTCILVVMGSVGFLINFFYSFKGQITNDHRKHSS